MNHKTKLRKFMRNSGQEYVTKKGKIVKAKVFENKDCGCSKRCLSKITSEERQKCFDKFWKMGNFSKQNAYLSGLVTREAVKQHRPRANCKNRGPKGVTYQYRINVGRISRQVCKVYFLDTFMVSNGRLARALRKEENEREPGEDLRGKKTPANKTSEENLSRVRDHISKFPHYDSHHTLNTKGKFLRADLNVKKMYRMYLEECEFKNVTFVKENIYRTVFNTEFNLAFLPPRKDSCIKIRLNIPKPQNRSNRKKISYPKSLMHYESENNMPMGVQQKFNVPPSFLCPSENVKCSYNPIMTTTAIQQEKEHIYPSSCQLITGTLPFYPQEQVPPTFHNQTSNFYNL